MLAIIPEAVPYPWVATVVGGLVVVVVYLAKRNVALGDHIRDTLRSDRDELVAMVTDCTRTLETVAELLK